jgi:DNA-binding transcriptional ArsR family regulator
LIIGLWSLDAPPTGVSPSNHPMINIGHECKERLAKKSLHSYGRSVPSDETPLEPAVQVTDVRALRALAHPLRNRLLGQLRLNGPATASQLGRVVGESSGSTSYHLRQLAEYGFVEEVEGQGTARERWWRARHRMTSWQAADLIAQDGGSEVQDEMTRLQIDQHARVLDAWRNQKEALGPEWAAVASLNDHGMRLRPDQARELADELNAVLDRWMTAHPGDQPADATELVFVLTDLVPLKEWPT